MKLFIDNVPTLVTEVTLLAPISRMFCPKVVYKMKPEMIAEIASEAEEKRWKREELSRKLETLESGWGICRRHVARMKAGKLSCPFTALFLTFANVKPAVQKPSAVADTEFGNVAFAEVKPAVPEPPEVPDTEFESMAFGLDARKFAVPAKFTFKNINLNR